VSKNIEEINRDLLEMWWIKDSGRLAFWATLYKLRWCCEFHDIAQSHNKQRQITTADQSICDASRRHIASQQSQSSYWRWKTNKYCTLFLYYHRYCRTKITRNSPVASHLVTGSRPFSGFENWSSQWLSRGNLDFWPTVRSRPMLQEIRPSVCPSVTLVYCGQTA